MIKILKTSAYKYGYLFIAAAWLYTVSFLFTNYFSFDSSPVKVASVLKKYISRQEQHFDELLKDSLLIQGIITNRPSTAKTQLWKDDIGIFAYTINEPGSPEELYWNTNIMSVGNEDLTRPDGHYAVSYQNSFFELLKKTVQKNNHEYIILGLIPIHWAYTIENENVQSRFAAYPQLEKSYTISSVNTGTPILNGAGETLFFLHSKTSTLLNDQPGTASIVLRVIAIIILMIFINSLATELAEQINFFTGFFFLLIIVIFFRTLTYFFHFPFDYSRLDLFDPRVYASSILHPSLGDLMINVILLYWFVSFIKYNVDKFKNIDFKLPEVVKKIIGIVSLSIIPLFTIKMAGSLTSLVKDSAETKISFNVTNFFSMNIYTIVSFIIICFIILCFFYISQFLVKLSLLARLTMYWRIIILLSFAFLFLSFKMGGSNDTVLNFALIAWLLIFYVCLNLRTDDIALSFFHSSSFMPWSIFLMASVSAFLIYQNQSLEQDKRITIAEKITTESDPANETILRIALTRFSSFISINSFSNFYSESENKTLKNNIINNNFQGYLKNYYTRIYTFDPVYRPLYNDDSTSFNVIKSIIMNQGRFTTVPDLYYYENAADKFSYIYEKDVYADDSIPLGYIFLIIRPRAYKDEEELTPQLFRQLVNDVSNLGQDYALAIYQNNRLIKSTSNYSFRDVIASKDLPQFEHEFRDNKDYSELWYKAAGNKVIIVARKNNWFPESVTFFAYLFGLLVVLVLIQHFGHLILKTHFKWDKIKKVFRFNIRTQIQVIIVTVSVISFIVIGIATISFFIIRFHRNNDEKLRTTAQILVNEIEKLNKDHGVVNNMFTGWDMNDLEKRILEIAEIHNTDINFFDAAGNLRITSQRYIYDNGILSNKMNPAAYYDMHYNHTTQFIQNEGVVSYSYLSIYVPVKSDDGRLLAYLNVPYINSQVELNQEISNFLVTLINLNALIFILAGAIAIWITRRITSSFTLIGNKMKAVNFGTVNEEIEWKKDDELGELVSEYNKMVKKLAESARALARSEREGAWREMARQVAHEIKNPLTPMKLSIQYLQRAIHNNAPNVKDLSRQVANTLVEQIDQLSKIAGDFSQFANITNVRKEVFDLSDVVGTIIQLYRTDERINIAWRKEEGTYMIEADRTQVHRLFTNLIKNAIEAYEGNEKVRIVIRQFKNHNEVIVSVEDKGTGIPEIMQPKIFAPNFTTKSSGTGLGLAICKGIVEKANGNIWFETKEDVGSKFFVSFPLV
ncbi:MAG TPA: HAMP domain-containing sensor histidine kinase [Chitinophagaceae bacterium]